MILVFLQFELTNLISCFQYYINAVVKIFEIKWKERVWDTMDKLNI